MLLKTLAVVKFGGSLIDFLGTNVPAILNSISEMRSGKDLGPLAVFSAPKGLTDRLQMIGEAKALGREYDLDSIFKSYSALASSIVNKNLMEEFLSELARFRIEVEETLLKVDRRFNGSNKAKVLTSGGELPTAMLIGCALRSKGLESHFLDKTEWPIVTDDNFENATPDFEMSRRRFSQLVNHLENGKILSVAGFLGITSDGLETLLGRGGSDRTAVFLSCLLKEQYDVDTILLKDTPVQSADPAVVRDQSLLNIPTMTYNEASKATIAGMTIIQNAAVRMAMLHRLRMTVAPLHTLKLGTVIQKEDPSPYIVKCVTGLRNCAIITMKNESSRSLEDCLRLWEDYDGFLDLGTEALETGQVIRDLLVLDADFVKRHEGQLKSFDNETRIEYGLGIVTLIGDKMRDSSGVASIAIGSIPDIEIKRGLFAPHTSQIILVVNEKDVPATIRKIHSQLDKINKQR